MITYNAPENLGQSLKWLSLFRERKKDDQHKKKKPLLYKKEQDQRCFHTTSR